MATDSGADRGREQGVDIGSLAAELATHDYPTTTDELVAAYGDHPIELIDGTRSLGALLGELATDDVSYESADEVRGMIYNLVGAGAVGREGYSDRGGIAGDREDVGGSAGERESF